LSSCLAVRLFCLLGRHAAFVFFLEPCLSDKKTSPLLYRLLVICKCQFPDNAGDCWQLAEVMTVACKTQPEKKNRLFCRLHNALPKAITYDHGH